MANDCSRYWETYCIRIATSSCDRCAVCNAMIAEGETYRDGGNWRVRAHERCVQESAGAAPPPILCAPHPPDATSPFKEAPLYRGGAERA